MIASRVVEVEGIGRKASRMIPHGVVVYSVNAGGGTDSAGSFMNTQTPASSPAYSYSTRPKPATNGVDRLSIMTGSVRMSARRGEMPALDPKYEASDHSWWR